jgi:hypothetical protein
MNTHLAFRLCGCLLIILLGSHTFAQKSDDKTLAAISLSQDAVITDNNSVPGIENVNINTKILGAFKESFDKVTNLNWVRVNNMFLAVFMIDGKYARALFTKRGVLVYTIFYGTENDLPAETRKLVKSLYIDHSITRAIKVNENGRTIWVISLEDSVSLISVRVENSELEQHYQKTK